MSTISQVHDTFWRITCKRSILGTRYFTFNANGISISYPNVRVQEILIALFTMSFYQAHTDMANAFHP